MANIFGGNWTIIKLELLRKYLAAYANVFKNQSYYNLIYIDAFAGSGKCDTKVGRIDGSTKIALETQRFNEYLFIESDENNVINLEALKKCYPNKKINIKNRDCNKIMTEIVNNYNWKSNRALIFLDPYSMQLSFSTLKLISSTKAIDVWYLFPFNSVTRSLKNDGGISITTENKLNDIFGSNDWKKELYYQDPQLSLFDDENNILRKDQQDICCYFYKNLKSIFPSVLCPVCLKNKNNAPLFLLYFAVSNESKAAQRAANSIASYLINKEGTFVCKNPKKTL